LVEKKSPITALKNTRHAVLDIPITCSPHFLIVIFPRGKIKGSTGQQQFQIQTDKREKTPEKCISGPAGGENGAFPEGVPPFSPPHPPPLFRASFFPQTIWNYCKKKK
jgi:hypothetical protein